MDKAFKIKTKEDFFELRAKLDALPEARDELICALRRAAVVNSTAIDIPNIDPMYLQLAPTRIPDRKWEKISSDYQSAMFETQALIQASELLEEITLSKIQLTVPLLMRLHRSVFERTHYSAAGKFRLTEDLTPFTCHDLPHHSKLPEMVDHHLTWLNHRLSIFSTVSRDNFLEMFHISAEGIFRFACSLPFGQGNGRFERLVGDYVLLYTGLLPTVIEYDTRDEYFEAISDSSIDGLAPLVNFLIMSFAKTLRRASGFVALAEGSGQEASRSRLL